MPRKKRASGKLRITYVKSGIGYSGRQKGTLRALGLKRLGDVVEHEDSPVVRGMVQKVIHLVEVEETSA
jgi:large subunit ribosomal protein L30